VDRREQHHGLNERKRCMHGRARQPVPPVKLRSAKAVNLG
jgi:hypothetical protein